MAKTLAMLAVVNSQPTVSEIRILLDRAVDAWEQGIQGLPMKNEIGESVLVGDMNQMMEISECYTGAANRLMEMLPQEEARKISREYCSKLRYLVQM